MNSAVSDTLLDESQEQDRKHFDRIIFPEKSSLNSSLSQDREWCDLVVDGERLRIRFHDYAAIFRYPTLYEKLFYEKLECCSPQVVVDMLEDISVEMGSDPADFNVLDLGAGNGMVGEELRRIGVDSVIGVDVIPEARMATCRDRPGVYDDYLVARLPELSTRQEERLEDREINCLTTVAALGFGDIPPAAFLKSLSLVTTPGWTAFNIKEDFLREVDSSGFSRLIRRLCRDEILQIQCYRRYRHRNSVAGKPLFYVAVVARKLRDLPEEIAADWMQ